MFLLDDPLSAVDASVGEHIWRRCIVRLLKGRGKTVIIVTHHTRFLTDADHVVQFGDDGQIVNSGTVEVFLIFGELSRLCLFCFFRK